MNIHQACQLHPTKSQVHDSFSNGLNKAVHSEWTISWWFSAPKFAASWNQTTRVSQQLRSSNPISNTEYGLPGVKPLKVMILP